MTEQYVGEGKQITMHFELALEDGEIIDSTFDGQPGTFVFGDDTLPEGFESLIRGLKAGEQNAWLVPPEKAFGQRNPNNMQTFSRADFESLSTAVLAEAPDDTAADNNAISDSEQNILQPGMVLSFADAARQELPGVVSEVGEDKVVIDFNHPLAGQSLRFRVDIITVTALD
jgi:FKBP-type peptidyl-prolyl cis-trans isomerase SlpA